jgi:integrase/recombinase XerD
MPTYENKNEIRILLNKYFVRFIIFFVILCANSVQIIYIFAHNNRPTMKPQITLYLDQRRSKSGNLFPVKLRVWDTMTKRAKLFPTNIDLGEIEFKQALESKKPKKEHQIIRIQLEAIKAKAQEVADELLLFTFEGFERKFLRKTGSGININYHYDQVIDRMKNYGQIGTASNYDLSLKSLLKFNQIRGGKTSMNLSFYDISADWLKGYENFMTTKTKVRVTQP